MAAIQRDERDERRHVILTCAGAEEPDEQTLCYYRRHYEGLAEQARTLQRRR